MGDSISREPGADVLVQPLPIEGLAGGQPHSSHAHLALTPWEAYQSLSVTHFTEPADPAAWPSSAHWLYPSSSATSKTRLTNSRPQSCWKLKTVEPSAPGTDTP